MCRYYRVDFSANLALGVEFAANLVSRSLVERTVVRRSESACL
jgi:hypothetical protein